MHSTVSFASYETVFPNCNRRESKSEQSSVFKQFKKISYSLDVREIVPWKSGLYSVGHVFAFVLIFTEQQERKKGAKVISPCLISLYSHTRCDLKCSDIHSQLSGEEEKQQKTKKNNIYTQPKNGGEEWRYPSQRWTHSITIFIILILLIFQAHFQQFRLSSDCRHYLCAHVPPFHHLLRVDLYLPQSPAVPMFIR